VRDDSIPPKGVVTQFSEPGKYGQSRVAVDDAAAVHAEVDAAEDAGIGLDESGSAVLVPVVVDADPGLAVIVGAVDGHGCAGRGLSIQEDRVSVRPRRGSADGDGVGVGDVDLCPCDTAVRGVVEAVAAEGQPEVSRFGEVGGEDATAGAIATFAGGQRAADLREDSGVAGGVDGSAVNCGVRAAQRDAVEELRGDLIRVDGGGVGQAGDGGPGVAVVKRELDRIIGGGPQDAGSAGVDGDHTSVIGVIAAGGAVGKGRPVGAVVSGVCAEVAGGGGVGAGSLDPDDEVRVLSGPVEAVGAGGDGVGVHALRRRDLELGVAEASDVAHAAEQMCA
jgi:hypothetical protein